MDDRTSLGDILIDAGWITREQLHEALEVQKSQQQLGRILVTLGYLTEDQLSEALLEQRIRREQTTVREVLQFQKCQKGRLLSRLNTAVAQLLNQLG